ncbi:MAG: sugar phosphate isomerase/epimerase family protein [Bryobacteraceae bacterium]|jgi:sugar phosphate isomerase/epimerase
MTESSRRRFLTATLSCATLSSPIAARASASPDDRSGFRYCLNTATVSGYHLNLANQIEVTARAGYQAIEPWVSSIYEDGAGKTAMMDLRNRIADRGLTVESAIAFPEWIVEDPGRRAKGLEQVRRDMEAVAQIGGKRIAMPPAGVQHEPGIALSSISERYRAVLELGDRMGVVPELEFWGTSPYLNRLSQAAFVALEVSHSKACVLADVFHLYKGGSGFEGLRLLSGQAIQVIHLNDYPGNPPRAGITDRDRVYPGDGVAPLNRILSDLQRVAPGAVLSLELFNPAYWKGDPLETAKAGLAKMKAATRGAASAEHAGAKSR